MQELWDATRPFAGWVYFGVLVFPAVLGGVWWAWQVRGGGTEPVSGLSRHELAFLKGGRRGVVLAAVRRLQRTGALSVTPRGLIHATEPRRRHRDRIDKVIVAHADHVLPKTFVPPLRPALRSIARRLEGRGLLVPRRDVRRRWLTVLALQLVVCVAGVALFVVARTLDRQAWLELLFLACAVLAVVIGARAGLRNDFVPTRRGTDTLVAAGLRRPRQSGPRRFAALTLLLALFARTSVPVPGDYQDGGDDEDDPDSWADGWSDVLGGSSDGGAGGGDSGGGDSGGGDSGGGDGGGGGD